MTSFGCRPVPCHVEGTRLDGRFRPGAAGAALRAPRGCRPMRMLGDQLVPIAIAIAQQRPLGAPEAPGGLRAATMPSPGAAVSRCGRWNRGAVEGCRTHARSWHHRDPGRGEPIASRSLRRQRARHGAIADTTASSTQLDTSPSFPGRGRIILRGLKTKPFALPTHSGGGGGVAEPHIRRTTAHDRARDRRLSPTLRVRAP